MHLINGKGSAQEGSACNRQLRHLFTLTIRGYFRFGEVVGVVGITSTVDYPLGRMSQCVVRGGCHAVMGNHYVCIVDLLSRGEALSVHSSKKKKKKIEEFLLKCF